MTITFTDGGRAGRIEWRVTDAGGAWGEVVRVEHADAELRSLLLHALDGNPLGVRVHGQPADDAGKDALAVVAVLEVFEQERPAFSFKLPGDWPQLVAPEGAMW